MTQLLFQRCDGKPAGEPVALPRGRRRLSSIVRRHADASRPHIVSVHRKAHPLAVTDASVRLRKTWRSTTIGPLDTVIIVYLPQGGGGASSSRSGGGGAGKGASIGLIVATIALAAIGQFWAIGAIGGALGVSTSVAGTIWAAGSAALLAGGAYLLSKATQAKANKTEENRPVYGVSGGGNQPRAGDRVPVIYGRCWTTPDLSQPDYTVYDGEDQVLYKRLTLGCGKYAVKTVRVSNVVMWTADGGLTPPFTGAALEVIAPGATSSLVPGAVASSSAVTGNELPRATDFPSWAGPFDFGSTAPVQQRIQLDYSVPQGCYSVPDAGKFQGKQFPANWGVIFEYAPCDLDGTPTGPFSTLFSDGAYALTTRAMRFTRFVDIAPGIYTFRARNTGDAESIPHSSGEFNALATNAVIWEGLRAHLPEAIVRPGVTELALRIRSGEALGITSYGEVEVEVSRILPIWTGSGWLEEETSKCVWAAADILRDQRHGAGLPDGRIDLARLLFYAGALSQYDQFNGVIRGPVSVYEALTTVLGTMRASPLRLGQTWTMVRDEAKTVRKHVISRRQIMRDSTAQTFNLDLSDGSADVIVEWLADGDPRRRREHRVTFGTATNVPRRMMATGATTSEHAIHIATWAAATAYYRRERRSVTTELAGRLLLPNDKALIDAWYFDAFVSAGIVGRDGYRLQLDGTVEIAEGSYVILRARDGREWGPVLVTQTGAAEIELDAADVAQAATLSGIALADVLSTATQAYTTAVFGELTEVQDGWLIRSIQFSGDSNVSIEAVYDAPQVWSALGETIIGPPPPPSSGLETPASIAVPYIRATAVQRNAAVFVDWTVGRARNAAYYVISISYDDWATQEEIYRGPQSSGSYPLREVDQTIGIRAFAVSQSGLRSLIVQSQFSCFPAVLDMGNAIHGSLAIEAFTDAIEPVGLVDGLPDPFGYTKPRIVANIQEDGKLYELLDGAWEPVVRANILDGEITETQIADDAISTPKLQANSVTATVIASSAVTTDKIAANAIVAGKIQAGAISADKINVTKLDAISTDIGSILAGALNINNRFLVDASGTMTILSAASGARLVITGSQVQVYDSSNVLRVRLGVW